MAGRVVQIQGGSAKTRREPIAPKLENLLNSVGDEAGVYFEVVSGGQDDKTGYTGSTRHDHGNAADLKAYTVNSDGSKHYLDQSNPNDRQTWEQIVKLSRAAGATGIGAAENYMGNEEMYIGFNGEDRTGPQARKASTYQGVWGAGGDAALAPSWLRSAWNDGGHLPPRDIPTAGGQAPAPVARPAAFSPPPPRTRPDFGIPARPMTEDGGKLSPQQVANLYAGILPPTPPKYGFDNAPASFGTPTVGGLSGADYTPGGFAPTAQTWDGRYATDPRMSQLGQPARPVIPPSVAPTLAQTRAEQMQMRPPVAPSLPPPPPPGMFPARPAGPPAGMPAAPPQPPQMDPISGQPISLSQFQDFLATGTPSTPPMPMARPPIPTSAPMPRPMPQQQQGGGNGSGGTYTVQPGDTLSGIASKLGTNVGTLAAANGISNPNQIMAGQRLSTGGGGQGYVPTPIARPMQAAMPPPPVPMNRPGALGGGGFLSGPPGQVNWNVADPGMGGLNGWQYGQPHPATAVGTALSVRPVRCWDACTGSPGGGGNGGGGGSGGGTIYTNPNKYGATQEERNAAAAHREWLANL
jgi:hypothetical protein